MSSPQRPRKRTHRIGGLWMLPTNVQSSGASYTITSNMTNVAPEPHGPLCRAQSALWRRPRTIWLGNLISDLRYWAWKVIR